MSALAKALILMGLGGLLTLGVCVGLLLHDTAASEYEQYAY